MKTTVSYRDAAVALWGEAGAYAHDTYAGLRTEHFPELPAELPIVMGITAYGHVVGLCRGDWEHGPRITLSSSLFGRGRGQVDDTLAHEMLHAWLHVTGQYEKHQGDPWYEGVRRLSPAILGRELDIRRGADRKSVRVPNPDYEPVSFGNFAAPPPKTLVRKVPADVGWTHDMITRWPQAFRPEGHDWGEPISCPSY